MNTKLTSVALALIATSAAAFGADVSQTGKTRAEVRAELEQAQAEGQRFQQTEFVDHSTIVTTAPRSAVRAELERAHAEQSYPSGASEFVVHAPIVGGKTRAEVRAEVEQAYADGTLGKTPEFVEHLNVASTRSRDEVRAEAVRAARGGSAEPSGS